MIVLCHCCRIIDDLIRMRLWVPGDANAKVIAVMLANVLDEIECAREAALDLLERTLARRRITTQCENVSNASRLDRREER